jgi:SAM-dependent methyltransferase
MDRWYYRIELPDGTFTNGRPRANLALCRQFFPRVEKTGLRCLDIGTQEFVAPVLFRRQGAAEVVAYDRLDLEPRRRVIAEAYGADFRYVAGLNLLGLRQHLRDHVIDARFDYVNFCGVLYHMIDPLAGLALARSFLRAGGVMILETSFSTEPGFVARVNHEGRLFPGSNYFQVSLEALDYWVRMLRMRILDAGFVGERHEPIGRVVAVCRAVDHPAAEPGDEWMGKDFVAQDFEPYGLDYAELASAAPPVVYRPGNRLVVRPGLDSVDLYQTYRRHGASRIDPELTALRLKDVA